MDVLYEWGKLEADFYRWYNIENPLDITWRKFLLLLAGLPMDKSLFFAKHYEQSLKEQGLIDDEPTTNSSRPSNYKQELDRKANRRGKRRTRMSIDDFIGQSDSLGSYTELSDLDK
tara:strand:+ start:1072 stop:1419 length:348 start_codon:yes stop_codon:yes gene_type:complete